MNRAPGPWFCEGGEHARSCRRLAEVATEFQAQGLELDAALVAWGTDLVRQGGAWSNANARGYKRGVKVRAGTRAANLQLLVTVSAADAALPSLLSTGADASGTRP